MKEIKYTVKDSLGIHARPAGLLVKETSKFVSDIIIYLFSLCHESEYLNLAVFFRIHHL